MARNQIFAAIAFLATITVLVGSTSFDKYDPGYGIYDDGHGDQPLSEKEYIQFISYYPTVYVGKLNRRGQPSVVFYRPLPLLLTPNKLPLVYVHTQIKPPKTLPDSAPARRY